MKTVAPSPIIFLSFANDHNGKFLKALRPEQDALQSILIQYQKKGWGNFYTAATSEPAKLLRDLNTYKDELIIFHFSGHNEGRNLQFENSEGNLTDFRDSSLVAFLKTCKNLKLVFLNACASMEHVKALQEAGIPAIIATHEPIGDRQAMKFSRAFYDSLISGDSLMESFDKAVGVLEMADGQVGALRSLNFGDEVHEHKKLSWGLFTLNEEILAWKLDKQIQSKWLTQQVFPPKFYVPRKKELERLSKALEESPKFLAIQGIGGIGKSTLAKAYVQQHGKAFRHIAWLGAGEFFTHAFTENYVLQDNLELDFLGNEKEEEKFQRILNRLNKQAGNNLLVLDNVPNSFLTYERYLQGLENWQVLMSTRANLEGVACMSLDKLSEKEAIALFQEIYPGESADDERLIKKIVERVGHHPLSIEMLAKVARKLGKPLEELTELVKMEGLNLSEKMKIAPQHYKDVAKMGDPPKVDHYDYLLKIFDISGLEEIEELWWLKMLSVLPPTPFDWESICFLFQVEEEEEKKELRHALIELRDAGWITEIEKGSWEMHQVVQEVIRYKEPPTVSTCQELLDSLMAYFWPDDLEFYIEQEGELVPNKILLEKIGRLDLKAILTAVLSNIQQVALDQEYFKLIYSTGKIYKEAGNYVEAVYFFKWYVDAAAHLGKNQFELLANAYSEVTESYLLNANYEEALNYSSFYRKLVLDLSGKDLLQLHYANVCTLEGLIRREFGEFQKAIGLLQTALKINEKAYSEDEDNPSLAASRSNLAIVYQDLGSYKKAANLFELALASNIKCLGEDHPTTATTRSNLALMYKDMASYEKAAGLLKLVLASDIQNFGEEHPKTANSCTNLAAVYKAQGFYEKAVSLLELALTSDIKIYGEEHPSTATRRSNLAAVYTAQGSYEKAAGLLELVLASAMKSFGEDYPSTAIIRSNLALVYTAQGSYEKAAGLLELALRSNLKSFGEEHPRAAIIRSNLAMVYQALEDNEKAAELMEFVLSSNLKSFGEGHLSAAGNRFNLASIYMKLERKDEAKELLTKAYATFLRKLGADHPNTKNCKSWLDSV